MKSFVTFALSLSLLAVWILGCASAPQPLFWTKPGASLDELVKVKYMCLKEAQQEVSHSRSNQYSGKSSSEVITNELLFESCMNAQGWFKSPVNDYANEQTINQPKVNKTEHAEDHPMVNKIEQAEDQPKINKTEHAEDQPKINKTEHAEDQPKVVQAQPMFVGKSKVKLRKSPSNKAVVIKSLKKGEEVQVIKQKDDWFLVKLAGGETGWCHKSVLGSKN